MKYENPKIDFDLSAVDSSAYESWDEVSLEKEGLKLFREAVQRSFNSNRRHCVPLSGGIDSRAVLAGLLECTSPDTIDTYTYGEPGAYDYDIGNEVAAKAGTRHVSFNLAAHEYSMDELIYTSLKMDHQIALFMHPSLWDIDTYFPDHQFWSGFFGDRLRGKFGSGGASSTLMEAKTKYVRQNTLSHSLQLKSDQCKAIQSLIEFDGKDNSAVTWDEQINLKNRQRKYTAISNLFGDYEYRVPFVDPALLTFMFSLGKRRHSVFKSIFMNNYPHLFSIRTKSSQGLTLDANRHIERLYYLGNKFREKCNKRWNIFFNRHMNYTDFSARMRRNSRFKELIYSNLSDLESRKVCDHVPVMEFWHEHQNGKKNHDFTILVLASLEIHLKAGKEL